MKIKVSITKLNDFDLLELTRKKAQGERNLTLEVIELLQEIQNRSLHLKSGFSSLHEYCVKELKYSDGAAARRIKAMKLVEQIPEAVKSIETGSLNLNTASQLQVVFETKAREKTPMASQEKMELFSQIQNQSKRQVEKIIAEICPEVVTKTEKVRHVGKNQIKLEIVIDEESFERTERLQKLTSHKNKNLKDLFENLVKQDLKRVDPELKKARTANKKNSGSSRKAATAPPATVFRVKSRYIPKAIKQFVWKRDKGECTFFDPVTKRKCESKHRLQHEHIQPFAMGGDNSAENLRLLCSAHNGFTATQVFGKAKMDDFVRRKSNV